jgi:hypothetical protein
VPHRIERTEPSDFYGSEGSLRERPVCTDSIAERRKWLRLGESSEQPPPSERTIYGCRSVAEHVRFDDEGPRLSLVYLHAAPSTAAARAIVACIETALVILFMCPHTFPGHLAAKAVHSEASKLREELDRYLDQHGYLRGEKSDDQ